jgi:hypothetical protein
MAPRARTFLLVAVTLCLPVLLLAQHAKEAKDEGKPAMAPAKKMTDAQKITNAMSAAPAAIAKDATIMDWPATPDGKPRELRAGKNGWVCYPNSPEMFGTKAIEDPMCLDAQWQKWAEAWMGKTEPKVSGSGLGYMLKGDKGASNTDPFATGPTASNHWVVSPPHVMVLYEDRKVLDSFPSDPQNGVLIPPVASSAAAGHRERRAQRRSARARQRARAVLLPAARASSSSPDHRG